MESMGAAWVEQLRARMTTHPDPEPYTGVPADISDMTPKQYGELWPVIFQLTRDCSFSDPRATLARTIQQRAEELAICPALTNEICIAIFRDIEDGRYKAALAHLPYLVDEPSPELRTELCRILGSAETRADTYSGVYETYALAYFAGDDVLSNVERELALRYANSSYVLREFEELRQLGSRAVLALADSANGYFTPKSFGLEQNDPAVCLSQEATYVEFSRKVLTMAAQRVADIQQGVVPYIADGAFTTHDAQVISRAARVAAYRDEPWFAELIGPLLKGVCVAPTAAKTAPSQSLAVTLGHSIEVIPTPESVRALREALSLVRHAGIEKKLVRNLKPAERALSGRPEIALRLTKGSKPDKKQQSMLAICMESGYWQGLSLSTSDWQANLLDASGGAAFTASMVWQVCDEYGLKQSFMIDASKKSRTLVDVQGNPFLLSDNGRICLWHPLLANSAERQAWQQKIVERQIKQPVRQVFREYYQAPEAEQAQCHTQLFAEHVLAIRPLLGMARREGWVIEKDVGLIRQFGPIRATFVVDAELYPGAAGYGESGKVYCEQRQGRRWAPVYITDMAPVVFSEICRAVDLLVSVAGFALHDASADIPLTMVEIQNDHTRQAQTSQYSSSHPLLARMRRMDFLSGLPLGEMARMRRRTLGMVFESLIEQGRVIIDERHVRVGDVAVHIATGRPTKNGAPVEVALQTETGGLGAVPWLPYDEVLLQRIFDTVWACLSN